MKRGFLALLVFSVTACSANNATAVAVARKLADEGGRELTQLERDGYTECGARALSWVPHAQLVAALQAANGPARWAILGSDALDNYVKICREFDLKRALPDKRNSMAS